MCEYVFLRRRQQTGFWRQTKSTKKLQFFKNFRSKGFYVNLHLLHWWEVYSAHAITQNTRSISGAIGTHNVHCSSSIITTPVSVSSICRMKQWEHKSLMKYSLRTAVRIHTASKCHIPSTKSNSPMNKLASMWDMCICSYSVWNSWSENNNFSPHYNHCEQRRISIHWNDTNSWVPSSRIDS